MSRSERRSTPLSKGCREEANLLLSLGGMPCSNEVRALCTKVDLDIEASPIGRGRRAGASASLTPSVKRASPDSIGHLASRIVWITRVFALVRSHHDQHRRTTDCKGLGRP